MTTFAPPTTAPSAGATSGSATSATVNDGGKAAPVRYGKGKVISTAADVLEGLAAEHDVPKLVLEYRQLSKLKGTYTDALAQAVAPKTG